MHCGNFKCFWALDWVCERTGCQKHNVHRMVDLHIYIYRTFKNLIYYIYISNHFLYPFQFTPMLWIKRMFVACPFLIPTPLHPGTASDILN